jgi:hypothetical protein
VRRAQCKSLPFHSFLVCAHGRRIVGDQAIHFLDVLIFEIPNFDPKREVVVAAAAHEALENKTNQSEFGFPLTSQSRGKDP